MKRLQRLNVVAPKNEVVTKVDMIIACISFMTFQDQKSKIEAQSKL